ncbi:MAG: hypothetical protein AB7W59_01830 [Acidimicrobiia bacterium]
MSAPLTAAAVAEQLAKLSRKLDELVASIGEAETKAVNAREDFTLAHAKAFLSAEGPMDVRRYVAVEATHVERLAAETAEALVRGLRRQIDSVRVRIDVGRSVGAAVRAEASLAGRDGAA